MQALESASCKEPADQVLFVQRLRDAVGAASSDQELIRICCTTLRAIELVQSLRHLVAAGFGRVWAAFCGELASLVWWQLERAAGCYAPDSC